MKVYLVRHGESLSSGTNPDQLSQRGILETEAVAQLLKQTAFDMDEILHSTKMRAKQTAEILGRILAPSLSLVQREGLKPMDSIDSILKELKLYERNVMLVGHLPFMEKLLTTLLTGEERPSPVNLCNSCVICLEGHDPSWQIAWVVSPALTFMSQASNN